MFFGKKIKFLILFLLLSFNLSAGLGNQGKGIYEVLGWLAGIFFIWALVKIIRQDHIEEEPENDIEIIDHFIDEDNSEE